MDSQMQTDFVNHILSFFTQQIKPDGAEQGGGSLTSSCSPGSPDLPVLLALLRAAGFTVKFSDKSEFGGVSNGCRAIILCKRSGTRVVLDGEGACTCPSEEEMKHYLDTGTQPPSRAASPTPSQSGLLEEPFRSVAGVGCTIKEESGCTIKEESGSGASLTTGSPPPAPRLSRQNTWSRDDEAKRGLASPESRRLSAPPAPARLGGPQSSWATITGDELNVMAATDLLQEAIALLAGIKKVNLRNTPVGPSRGAARRLSAETFAMPFRPISSLSRASSVSSGLASSRSTSSLHSVRSNQSDTHSDTHSDTPRPVKPASTVRRAASASSSTSTRPLVMVRARAEGSKKGPLSSSAQRPVGSRLPSFLKPSSSVGAKPSPRTPLRSGLIPPKIKTNSSLNMAKLSEPKSQSPETESIKL